MKGVVDAQAACKSKLSHKIETNLKNGHFKAALDLLTRELRAAGGESGLEFGQSKIMMDTVSRLLIGRKIFTQRAPLSQSDLGIEVSELQQSLARHPGISAEEYFRFQKIQVMLRILALAADSKSDKKTGEKYDPAGKLLEERQRDIQNFEKSMPKIIEHYQSQNPLRSEITQVVSPLPNVKGAFHLGADDLVALRVLQKANSEGLHLPPCNPETPSSRSSLPDTPAPGPGVAVPAQ